MKKYFVLGIVVLALGAAMLSFPWNQETKAGPSEPAFYGAFESGRTVGAQQGPFWYAGHDNGNNTYYISIPPWNTGWFTVTDGCQHFNRFWDGDTGTEVNFCVPQTCECN